MRDYDAFPSVKIPVTIREGKVFDIHGRPLEEFVACGEGTLVVKNRSVKQAYRFDFKGVKTLMKGYKIIYLEMGLTAPDYTGWRQAGDFFDDGMGRHFVQVKLNSELRLEMKLWRRSALMPSEVDSPFFRDETRSSLNQAYTRLSELLQSSRVSHTGNVFELACYRVNNSLVSLGDLRDQCDYELAELILHDAPFMIIDVELCNSVLSGLLDKHNLRLMGVGSYTLNGLFHILGFDADCIRARKAFEEALFKLYCSDAVML